MIPLHQRSLLIIVQVWYINYSTWNISPRPRSSPAVPLVALIHKLDHDRGVTAAEELTQTNSDRQAPGPPIGRRQARYLPTHGRHSCTRTPTWPTRRTAVSWARMADRP